MAFSGAISLGEARRSQWSSSASYGLSAGAAQPGAASAAQTTAMHGERDPEFLTFSCAGIACAAPLVTIREALMSAPAIASLPDSPPWFLGVFQLRAEIIGAADIRQLLTGQPISGEEPPAHDAYPPLTGHERAIIVGKGARSLALIVESVGDILVLRPHEVLRDLVEHPAFGVIAPRYRLGLLAPDGHPTRFALVALDILLTDMLTALTDQEAPTYA
jgi:chemotaxis signal transduction protein